MTVTRPYDPADHLRDDESQAALISDALESGDATYIKVALGTVARARGMTGVADKAGVTREALYRALSEDGDPRLSTLLGVVQALGLSMTLAATPQTPARQDHPEAGQ